MLEAPFPGSNRMVAAEADAGGEARTGSERDGLATGSGRRPGRAPDRQVQLSKALSKLLRHQADKAGIKLDDEGFAPLDQVVGGSHVDLVLVAASPAALGSAG